MVTTYYERLVLFDVFGNDAYARDISRKMKAMLKNKGNNVHIYIH